MRRVLETLQVFKSNILRYAQLINKRGLDLVLPLTSYQTIASIPLRKEWSNVAGIPTGAGCGLTFFAYFLIPLPKHSKERQFGVVIFPFRVVNT